MHGPIDLRTTLVRSRMAELEAEAARERLAAQVHDRLPIGEGLRRWLGRRLVLAGSAIARDGLVEGSGEPIAQAVSGASPATARPDPCFDAEPTMGHAA